MKSFTFILSGLALVSVSKAASCSAANAERVTVNTEGESGGGGGGGGGGYIPNRFGCIDWETYENRCEIEYRRFALKRSLMTVSKRDLDCTSSEACISLEGEIICYNPTNDDFHIEDGSKGNFRTGDYILPDGQTGNYFNGPMPTPYSVTAAGSSSTSVLNSSEASSTPKPGNPTTTSPASASVSPASASASSASATVSPASATTTSASATTTPNAGNQKRGQEHLVGVIVGVAGLLAF